MHLCTLALKLILATASKQLFFILKEELNFQAQLLDIYADK